MNLLQKMEMELTESIYYTVAVWEKGYELVADTTHAYIFLKKWISYNKI